MREQRAREELAVATAQEQRLRDELAEQQALLARQQQLQREYAMQQRRHEQLQGLQRQHQLQKMQEEGSALSKAHAEAQALAAGSSFIDIGSLPMHSDARR